MKEKNPSLLIVLLLLLLQKFLSSFFFFSSSFSLQKSFHASSSYSSSCTKPSITDDTKPMLKKRILHSWFSSSLKNCFHASSSSSSSYTQLTMLNWKGSHQIWSQPLRTRISMQKKNSRIPTRSGNRSSSSDPTTITTALHLPSSDEDDLVPPPHQWIQSMNTMNTTINVFWQSID